MTKLKLFSATCAAIFAATVSMGTASHAAPLNFQAGDGQSVTSGDVDLQTSFAGIGTYQSFLNYQNNGISVTVDDQNINTPSAFFFNSLNATQGDGFAYGNNGNNSFFTVSAVSGADIFGLEFQYGNGVGEDTMNLAWVALNNGVEVDSGVQSNAQRGSFYGISGSTAFDEVRLSAYRTGDLNNCNNDINCVSPIQFIAIDNLRIDLDGPPVAAVPLPAGGGLLLTALGGLVAYRRLRKS